MNFEFKKKITKEYLLSKNNEETYLSYYLGLPVKKGLFINPLRVDNKPTASFYKSKSGEIIFKDFGSDFSGNFISVVMTKFNLTYYQALEKIACDFGYTNNNKEYNSIKFNHNKFDDKGPTIINIQSKPFSQTELDWWKKYGITETILNKFNIHSCKCIFLNKKVISFSSDKFPIYGYYFGLRDNIEQWRIYYPKRKSYRFLSNTKFDIVQGLKQLPEKGKLLVITKSLKDVACLYSLNINAIAPLSENQFITHDLLLKLKERFDNIVVFYDNDLPGISGLNRIKKKYPELLFTFIPRKYNAKDISDFYKQYGKNKTIKLIVQYLKWIKS